MNRILLVKMINEFPICIGFKNISSITPTICNAMKIAYPLNTTDEVISEVINHIQQNRIDKIEKCLIYAPDAIAHYLTIRYSSDFEIMEKLTHVNVKLCSIFPPKTPVCFASMFTGALPDVHGINEYKRPVLKIDTLFDALSRNGKKVAIVAVENSSIDLIFRERDISYYSEKNDLEVTHKAIELLENDNYDFLLVYHQEYDDTLHETTPISEKALEGMKNHIKSFEILNNKMNAVWQNYDHMICFCPDHGAHISYENGKGTHGSNIPEDMIIRHYFGVHKKKKD